MWFNFLNVQNLRHKALLIWKKENPVFVDRNFTYYKNPPLNIFRGVDLVSRFTNFYTLKD